MQAWHSAYGSTYDQAVDNKGSDSLENVQSPRDSPPDYDTGSLPKTPESPVKVAPFEASEGYDINIGDDFDDDLLIEMSKNKGKSTNRGKAAGATRTK